MLASKKASVSRQGRRVHSLQDMMAFLESKDTQFKHMIKIIIVHQFDRFVLREELWRTLLIVAPFFWAYEPHSMKTRPSRLLLSQCTTESVNVSQPLSLCEFAWWARTVNTAFSSNTPDEWSHSMAGLFMSRKKTTSSDMQILKGYLQKYLVVPSQLDLHAWGAQSLQCLMPVLYTCSPN